MIDEGRKKQQQQPSEKSYKDLNLWNWHNVSRKVHWNRFRLYRTTKHISRYHWDCWRRVNAYWICKFRCYAFSALLNTARFDVCTAMKVQIMAFWIVTPYSDVGRYKLFVYHAATIFTSPWWWGQQSPTNRWYSTPSPDNSNWKDSSFDSHKKFKYYNSWRRSFITIFFFNIGNNTLLRRTYKMCWDVPPKFQKVCLVVHRTMR
jgi:hypothetical protein